MATKGVRKKKKIKKKKPLYIWVDEELLARSKNLGKAFAMPYSQIIRSCLAYGLDRLEQDVKDEGETQVLNIKTNKRAPDLGLDLNEAD